MEPQPTHMPAGHSDTKALNLDIERCVTVRETAKRRPGWSLKAATVAAATGKWRTYTEATVVFGHNIDERWWCSCCTGGIKPIPTSAQAGMSRSDALAAKAHPLELDELVQLPQQLISQGIIQHCKELEKLTLEFKIPQAHDTGSFLPLEVYRRMSSWNVFSDRPAYYGVPPKDAEETQVGKAEYIDQYADFVPPLQSLTLVNWIVSKTDLEDIANSFPNLTKLSIIAPIWDTGCAEAVQLWYADRLPFLELKEDNYNDLELEPLEQKACPHVVV